MDWATLTNDLVTAALVLTFELCIFLPFIGWYVLRVIKAQMPEILEVIATDEKSLEALKRLGQKFGLPDLSKITPQKAIGQALAMGLPYLMQRLLGGTMPPPQPPVTPPPP